MPKSDGQKQRILHLVRILREETDEDHQLTVSEILSLLENEGIAADRKSIYDDLTCLEEAGLDLERRRGRGGGVALLSRQFETAELKLLIDMVQSSAFITEKKSRALIEKLTALASRHESAALHRHVHIAGRVKTENEKIFYCVDLLNEAIENERQVRFRYADRGGDGGKIYHRNGEYYVLSPWELQINDGRYYLIAYDSEKASFRHFRVDKMEDAEILDLPRGREGKRKMEERELGDYASEIFEMFGGEPELVTLGVPEALTGAIYDRFGGDTRFRRTADGMYECSVRVVPSERFFGWLAGFGGDLTLLFPETVREEYRKMLERILLGATPGDHVS